MGFLAWNPWTEGCCFNASSLSLPAYEFGSHSCFKIFAQLPVLQGHYINSMTENLSPAPLPGHWLLGPVDSM